MPLKPGIWSVNTADIDPRFLGLWKDLRAVFPLWEGSGSPHELLTSTVPSDAGGTWVPTSTGFGYDINALDSEFLDWNSGVLDMSFKGDVAFSIFLVVDIEVFNGDFSGFISHRTNVSDGVWHIFRNGNNLKFDWINSGTAGLTFTNAMPSGTTGQTTILLTRRVGGEYEAWVNGISFGTLTDTKTFNSTNHNFGIGVLQAGDGGNTVGGKYQIAAIWDRAFTDAEARLLDQDPFGLLRQSLFISDLDTRFIRSNLQSRQALQFDNDRLVSTGLISAGKST